MRVFALLPLLLLVGCPSPDDTTAPNTDVCTLPETPPCVDAMILDLSLHEAVSTGVVTNVADGDGWVTTVDASAGGYQNAASRPWVYLKFTDTGAQKVDIGDESALESMDWDLSARRFILRLNGGTSGPSCVGAAAFLERTYEDLTSVPDGMTFATDSYYTSDCTIINDSSGLPGSPQVALAPWWSYTDCVVTSSKPFLIQLQDGRVVRFIVDSYYKTGQDGCNTGAGPGTDAGNYVMRWAFVQ